MNNLDEDFRVGLLNNWDSPCLSLYQPTHRHHPDNRQDPIRFGNLIRKLEESLAQRFRKDDIRSLLKPFRTLAESKEFWKHTLDGLAVLGAGGFFRVYNLQRPVRELAVVADSFHIKPLMHITETTDRYHVLGLSRKAIRLFEGNRDVLDEIEPAEGVPRTITEALGDQLTEPHQTVASYGGIGVGRAPMRHGHGGKDAEVDIDAERFFRAVDRAVIEHHSQPAAMPLILAALPEHHHTFHKVSRNSFLMSDCIDVHPDALPSLDNLRERAWQIMEPRYLERLADLVDEFGSAKSRGLGGYRLAAVAKAAAGGRVAKLLIEDHRLIPGRLNAATGAIEPEDVAHPEVDDLLDDLAELTQKRGGQVVVVPADQMPTTTGLAAIYRY